MLSRREFIKSCGGFLAALPIRLPWLKPKRQFDEITALETHDNRTLYMMGYEDSKCYIVKSDDWGATFCEVCQFALESPPTSMALLDPVWFVGCENGDLWSSEDQGQTWKREEYELIETSAYDFLS